MAEGKVSLTAKFVMVDEKRYDELVKAEEELKEKKKPPVPRPEQTGTLPPQGLSYSQLMELNQSYLQTIEHLDEDNAELMAQNERHCQTISTLEEELGQQSTAAPRPEQYAKLVEENDALADQNAELLAENNKLTEGNITLANRVTELWNQLKALEATLRAKEQELENMFMGRYNTKEEGYAILNRIDTEVSKLAEFIGDLGSTA